MSEEKVKYIKNKGGRPKIEDDNILNSYSIDLVKMT